MTFSSFFGRKCCKTQDVHDPLPEPRFPCGRPSRGATRSCRQHRPKSSLHTPVKNNKNTRFVISFHFVFYFISFHLISFHCVLFIESFIHPVIHSFHSIPFHFISFHFIPFHFISFHFIHSFNHAFHGCAFQASLSAGLRSSVKAFPQRHFGPLPTKFVQTRMITCCIRVLGSFGQHITLGVQDFVHQPVSPVEISHAYTIKKHHQVEARFFISHVNRRMRPIKQYDATRATKMPDGGMCEVDEIWTEKCFC